MFKIYNNINKKQKQKQNWLIANQLNIEIL
jgi:hypothetical protein